MNALRYYSCLVALVALTPIVLSLYCIKLVTRPLFSCCDRIVNQLCDWGTS